MVHNHWGAGNQYQVDDVVEYEGFYYKVIQAHTSQNDWAPPLVPALFGKQGPVGEGFTSVEVHDDLKAQYQQVENTPPNAPHEAKLTHELLAGAGTFAAIKAWEHHKAKNGEPLQHAKALEIGGALIGGLIDRVVETKGLDYIDKRKAKKEAEEQFSAQVSSNYQT